MNLFLKIYGVFVIFLGMLCLGEARAATPEQETLYSQAAIYYEQNEFHQARRLYEELLDQGLRYAHVYYNLANTYFRLGKKGFARLYYERAKKVIPRDPDVNANLRYLVDHLPIREELHQAWWQRWRNAFATFFSMRVWALMGGGAMLALCCILSLSLWLRVLQRSRLGLAVTCLAIILMSWCGTYFRYQQDVGIPAAVIVIPTVDVRYSPSYQGAIAFELPEAVRIRLLRTEGSWSFIRFGPDKTGWIPSDAFLVI